MKILAIIKNKAQKNDTVVSPTDGKLIPFKSFCVINFARSISEVEHGTLEIANKDALNKAEQSKFDIFFDKFDLIITYGFKDKKIRSYYLRNQHKFLIIEQPVIFRKAKESFRDQEFIRIMAGDYTGINFISKYSSGTIRPGFPTPPTISTDKAKNKILIVNQVVGDVAIAPQDPYEWVHSVLEELNKIQPGKDIVIREHPLQLQKAEEAFSIEAIKKYSNLSISVSNNLDIEDDFSESLATITFSSGSALDSLINGVPAITLDPRSFVYEITPHELNNLSDLHLPCLSSTLSAMSYTHYRLNEILNGTAWSSLKGKIFDESFSSH